MIIPYNKLNKNGLMDRLRVQDDLNLNQKVMITKLTDKNLSLTKRVDTQTDLLGTQRKILKERLERVQSPI